MPKSNDPFAPSNLPPAPLTDTEREAEEQMEKLNQRPALQFVERHIDEYRHRVETFFSRAEFPESRVFADSIPITDFNEVTAQISIEDMRNIIARIPPHLAQRSTLQGIECDDQEKVAVPGFGENGIMNRPPELVDVRDFLLSNHHQQRIILGITNRYSNPDAPATSFSFIKPTAIPESISQNPEAVRFYQLHVFLHELFHTIEADYRDEATAGAWIIDGQSGRNFADWKRDYANACAKDPSVNSFYANVYTEALFNTDDGVPHAFGFMVREWMCEDWVGSTLGILPNADGNIDRPHGKRKALFEELLATPE